MRCESAVLRSYFLWVKDHVVVADDPPGPTAAIWNRYLAPFFRPFIRTHVRVTVVQVVQFLVEPLLETRIRYDVASREEAQVSRAVLRAGKATLTPPTDAGAAVVPRGEGSVSGGTTALLPGSASRGSTTAPEDDATVEVYPGLVTVTRTRITLPASALRIV